MGREPALRGLGRPPLGLPLRLGLETQGVGGAPLALGGKPPPWPPPPSDGISRVAGPPRTPINSGGEGGQQDHSPWRLPLPLQHLSLPLVLGEALLGSPLLPPPRRRATGSPSTSPSPLLDQEGADVAAPYVC